MGIAAPWRAISFGENTVTGEYVSPSEVGMVDPVTTNFSSLTVSAASPPAVWAEAAVAANAGRESASSRASPHERGVRVEFMRFTGVCGERGQGACTSL